MKRLEHDDGSTQSIKRDLRRQPGADTSFAAFSSTVTKCPNLIPEEPCSLGLSTPFDFRCREVQQPHSEGPAKTCSCCSRAPTEAPEAPAEQDAAVECAKPFESFSCSLSPPISCLNGQCYYSSRPIYRRNILDSDRITSPVAGGGDAFVSRGGAHALAARSKPSTDSLIDDYEDLAILDSGANRHAFGNTRIVSNRRPFNLRTTTADGSQVRISEEGDVIIPSVDDSGHDIDPLILRDVSIIKGSPINLVSIGVLCNEGSQFHFERGNSYFIYEGKKICLIERNGLYMIRLNDVLEHGEINNLLQCELELGNPCTTEAKSKTGTTYACAATWELWHQRFGHASKKRLKFLFDNGSAEGMAVRGKYTHDRKCTCPTCMAVNNAKLHVGEVRKFGDTVTQRGELILSDLCGPFPASVEGHKYVISFTDTYSRFSVCYMLKHKSDAEEALKALIKYYARHGALIQEIRTDQGGEFGWSNETFSHSGGSGTLQTKDSLDFFFKRVCEAHKIKHVLMPAHRPELHGLAERWNMTVMKMANSMLFSARLSHILWSSAVAHANLLRNRLPLSGLGPYTPYELFFHKRPRVDQLRVFGSDCYKLLPTYPKIPGQQARKRLIYCGESADRVGFRCFDPISYRFSTEFELTFNEDSASKRIDALFEYDARRDLKRKGLLHKLPLQADDYTGMSQPQQAVRNVFSPNVSSPSQVLESGGAGGEIGMKEGISHMPESTVNGDGSSSSSEANRQPRNERSPPTASASHRPLQHDGRRTQDQKRKASDTPRTDISSKPNALTESAPTFDDADDMGRQANLQESTRTSSLQREKTPTSTTAEESEGESEPEEEFKINSRSILSGRLPTLRPRKIQASLKLNEVEGASTLLNDAEADEFGPLTKAALEKERRRSKHDPSQPRRPLRLLPSGQIEKDSAESKAFRKFALENDSFIQLVPNPKQAGKDSWKRYERYKLATTLRELVELSITSKKPRVRAAQVEKARADIINDYCRGYILFPQLEHNASSHFVDATKLARKVGTVNIHALFSHDEMQSASKAAAAEEKKTITELIAAHIDTAKAREVSSTPLKFHDQIRALWEYDKMIQLSDVDVKQFRDQILHPPSI